MHKLTPALQVPVSKNGQCHQLFPVVRVKELLLNFVQPNALMLIVHVEHVDGTLLLMTLAEAPSKSETNSRESCQRTEQELADSVPCLGGTATASIHNFSPIKLQRGVKGLQSTRFEDRDLWSSEAGRRRRRRGGGGGKVYRTRIITRTIVQR